MTCPRQAEETMDLLLDYSAGTLDSERKALLEGHMQVCPECAAFGAEQAALWNTLDVWEPEPVSLDFNRRLWHRIESTVQVSWHKKLGDTLRFSLWKPALPLAAAAALVAIAFVSDHPRNVPVSPGIGSSAIVSAVEADQAEKTLDDLQLLKQL